MRISDWSSDVCSSDLESWRASDGFLTNGGTTVSYGSRGHDAWSPKAALSLRPDDLTEIVASAALATRFPTVRELYQAGLIAYGPNVGALDLNGFNPDLKPEKAVDLQLTASRRIGNVKVTLRSEEHTSELQSLMRISYAVLSLQKITNRNTNT